MARHSAGTKTVFLLSSQDDGERPLARLRVGGDRLTYRATHGTSCVSSSSV